MPTDSIRVYSGQYANHWETVELPAPEIRDLLADVDSLAQKYQGQ